MRPTHRPFTVTALLAALFMAAMEMTVVSTAMPTVVGDLGGIHRYAWVFTAYMLAATVTVPVFGKLADIYGRKPVLLVGVGLFLVGSLGCGLAPSMTTLIAFRALQGLGAGSIQPVSLTIVGDLFTLAERGRMQGIFGAIWGFAGLVGPLVGSAIVRVASWRWVFFLNLPFGLVSVAILLWAYHEQVAPREHPLDLAGAALLALAILALLAAAEGGTSMLVLPLAALLVMALVRVEHRAPEPILPIDLFLEPVLGMATVLGALVGGAMFATVTYVPLYVQAVLRGTPTDAGSAITPLVVGWPIASAVAGRLLPRTGYRALVRGGLALTAAAAIGLALLLRPGASLLVPRLATLLFGMGLGFANTALLLAVQTSVPWRRRGVATASTMFARSIGATLVVGALGGVLAARLVGVPGVPAGAADQLLGPLHGASLEPALLARLGQALAAALGVVLVAIASLAVLAAVIGFFFPRVGLSDAPEGAVDGLAALAETEMGSGAELEAGP